MEQLDPRAISIKEPAGIFSNFIYKLGNKNDSFNHLAKMGKTT